MLAVLDCETSSLPYQEPRAGVLETAAVVLSRDGAIVALWESLSNPGRNRWKGVWADRALKLNGISRRAISGAPFAYQVAANLADFLGRHGVTHLTSFNMGFDFHPRLLGGMPWSDALSRFCRGPCLMEAAKFALKKHPCARVGLAAACSDLHVPGPEVAHQALEDAVAAAYIAQRIWWPEQLLATILVGGNTCYYETLAPRPVREEGRRHAS